MPSSRRQYGAGRPHTGSHSSDVYTLVARTLEHTQPLSAKLRTINVRIFRNSIFLTLDEEKGTKGYQ
jgi:hypothetical protein